MLCAWQTHKPSIALRNQVDQLLGRQGICSSVMFGFLLIITALTLTWGTEETQADECRITPVIHVLKYPGCNQKPIPSFACQGRCTSYVQVSGSKLWQMERSCMCCQEMGVREANVTLHCPNARPGEPKFRKVTTRAPVDCMCRPCTAVEKHLVLPQEVAPWVAQSTLEEAVLAV